jgi:hypothetical protein
LVSETVAPETALFCGSNTVPCTDEVPLWPQALVLKERTHAEARSIEIACISPEILLSIESSKNSEIGSRQNWPSQSC